MGNDGLRTFPNCIIPKVNEIARLEFELAYFVAVVSDFHHYTIRNPSQYHVTGDKR